MKNKLSCGADFNSSEQIEKLLNLLDQGSATLDDEMLKILLRVYTSTLDWETQERIENILTEVDEPMWVKTVLGEMPRLLSDSPEWASSLLGEEIEHRFQMVQECLLQMPEETQRAVKSVVQSNDFTAFYSKAESLFK